MAGPRSLLSAARLLAGFASPRLRVGRSWNDAMSLVRSDACAGISVDCFDTLLARAMPDWEQRILAQIVGSSARRADGNAANMLSAAHRRARRHGGADGEPSAHLVWAEYCNALGLPGRVAARMSAHEFELLALTSAASTEALEFITTVENHNLPWVICSDTRWSRTELSRLLALKGFAVSENAIFSSCDHGRSKFRGGLYAIAYEHLRRTLGPQVARDNIVHVGNNFLADDCSAACFGMRTVGIPPARLSLDAATTAPVTEWLEAIRREVADELR